MKYIKLVLLVALTVALAGCGDDDYNGGGDSGGGDYGTYWDVLDIITGGDVANMTQKPESPAPAGDQEECPGIVTVAVLLVLYYNIRSHRPEIALKISEQVDHPSRRFQGVEATG